MKCGRGLSIFGSSGRTSVEDERDLLKSWPSGSTESGTSDLWQSRQSRSAEAEFHIFGSPGRGEMRKWTYPHLEVLVEQVRKKNEIFRSPGRAEVRKPELLIFGSKGRAELRKRSFRPLNVLEEQSWCAEAELHIVGSQGRTEVRKQNFTSYEELAEQKCGTDFMSHHWVRPNGSAGAEFQIFESPTKFEVWKHTSLTSLTGPYPTDCHCHC